MRFASACCFVGLLLVSAAASGATTIRTGDATGPLDRPTITVLSSNDRGVDLVFELPAVSIDDVTAGGRQFRTVAIPGGDLEGDVGQPAIPVFTRLLAIPDRAAVTVTAMREDDSELTGPPLAPMQTEEGSDVAYDEAAYAVDSYGATSATDAGHPGIMRDLRLVTLTFRPVQYNPARQTLKISSRIHVRVDFAGVDLENARTPRPRPMAPSFDRIYRELVANYSGPPAGEQATPGTYLIICPNTSEVISRLQPLVQWRMRKGMPTRLVTYADTGTSKEGIKAYIQNAYDTWPVPPEYVCLVGDASSSNVLCPTWHETVSGYYGEGDHPYTKLEGNDVLADIHIGRLSVNSYDELQLVVQKITGYESAPPVDDPGWFQRACLVGDPRDSGYSTVQVQQWIKHRLHALGFVNANIDTVFSSPFVSQWANAWNRGDVIVSYRGIQGLSGWRNSNTYSLHNGWEMPFCVAITCDSGSFESDQVAASEGFLRAGAIDAPKGGIGAIGTSTSGTHTRFNNCFHYGVFYGLLYQEHYNLGAALTRGKLEMYLNYQQNDPDHVIIWSTWNNLMGDPALECWTGYPAPLTASYPSTIPIGTNSVTLNVSEMGLPSVGALVCLWKGTETYAVGYTDARGNVELPVSTPTAGDMLVTMSKHNHATHQGTIHVAAQAQFVGYQESQVDDNNAGASHGNGDGIVNPGEMIGLPVQLRNFGIQIAHGVAATLTTTDPYVTSDHAQAHFGDIAPGASAWSDTAYAFVVDRTCPNGHRIRFGLDVTTEEGQWHSLIDVPVVSADLAATGYTLYNAGSNGMLDPGETVQISVILNNNGGADAATPTAMLLTQSQYVDIVDRNGSYATIPIGGTAENAGDTFTIHAAAGSYRGYVATLRLVLTFSGGMTDTTLFTVPIGTRMESDPTGPDAYGYYAFDNSDLLYPEHPTYNWIECDPAYGGSGATEIVLGDYGDYQDKSAVVDLPFPFKYYGVTYSKATVCTNGWVAMGSQPNTEYRNWTIPGAGGPEAMIAAFWDDLYQQSGTSKAFQKYDAANHQWVVEWSHFKDSYNSAQETFEVILRDPSFWPTGTGDGEIVIQYQAVTNGDNIDGNATVGIENQDQSVGLLWTFFNRYTPGSATLSASRAIRFIPKREFIAGVGAEQAAASTFALSQNRPNPFNPQTAIHFSLVNGGPASLTVFDVSGRAVRRLLNGPAAPGSHTVVWDGRDDAGHALPSGIYLYRLDADHRSETRKMILVQ